MIDQPSWADAPAWATHLLRHDTNFPHEVYAWACDGGDRRLYAGPAGHVNARLQLVVGEHDDLWKMIETRPAAPAADIGHCGQCHFAGPVEMRMCLCRRHAPTGVRNPPHVVDIRSGCLSSAAPAFPLMAAERDWCGDFRRREAGA
jgi:hypothetical protein